MAVRLGVACRHFIRGLTRPSPVRLSGLAIRTVKEAGSYRSVNSFKALSTASAQVASDDVDFKPLSTASVQVASDGGSLTLKVNGGEDISFHSVWLRHCCRCPLCISANEKTVDPCDIDPKLTVESASISDSKLNLVWSNGHYGYIELDWLMKRRPRAIQQGREDSSTPKVASEIPVLSAAGMAEDKERLWKWLHYVNEYGICLLTDLGTELEAAEKLVKQTLYSVQSSIYGQTLRVIAMEKTISTGYTTNFLEFHMDQQFYESPPGLQLLHCLKFNDCVEGGESIMLDLFAVVEELREKYPKYFDTLVRVPATFERIHYDRDEPVDITRQVPHIQLDGYGKIVCIRWTATMEGPLDVPPEDIQPYFEAHHCLAQMIKGSPLKLKHRLRPGEALTFNNRRMAHSRTKFELNGGQRHFKGVYANIDHFSSKLRVLQEQLGKTDVPIRRVFNMNSM